MLDYRDSGVDREGAQTWIESLKAQVESTKRQEVMSSLGGFAAGFQAPANMNDPVWFATTDGVGTKLLLVEQAGVEAYFGAGIDLVAMSVNDLLACRAEPLVFLDYLACGKLDAQRDTALLKGVIEGCRQAGCALIGGETAEMPGFYVGKRLDVAGFAVGVAERAKLWQKQSVGEGDVLLGVSSNGFHSNGYSLVRKIMEKQAWDLSTEIEGEPLAQSLLKPTRIYIRELLPILLEGGVNAGVHITGGGLVENLPRVFDEAIFQAEISLGSWAPPEIMTTFAREARVEEREAYSTWNMGVGFVVVAEKSKARELVSQHPDLLFECGRIRRKSSSADRSVELLQ